MYLRSGDWLRSNVHPYRATLPDIRGRNGFEFMRPLIDDMVQDDPSKRPNIDEVVRRFEESVRRLSVLKLRSRVVSKTDSSLKGWC